MTTTTFLVPKSSAELETVLGCIENSGLSQETKSKLWNDLLAYFQSGLFLRRQCGEVVIVLFGPTRFIPGITPDIHRYSWSRGYRRRRPGVQCNAP